jgi:hypothetical protein
MVEIETSPEFRTAKNLAATPSPRPAETTRATKRPSDRASCTSNRVATRIQTWTGDVLMSSFQIQLKMLARCRN